MSESTPNQAETNPAPAANKLAELQTELAVLQERRAVHEAAALESAIERENHLERLEGWEQAFPEGRAIESFSFNGSEIVDPRDYLPSG